MAPLSHRSGQALHAHRNTAMSSCEPPEITDTSRPSGDLARATGMSGTADAATRGYADILAIVPAGQAFQSKSMPIRGTSPSILPRGVT